MVKYGRERKVVVYYHSTWKYESDKGFAKRRIDDMVKLISRISDMELVGVYFDGCESKKERSQFNKLLEDLKSGKFDLVFVESFWNLLDQWEESSDLLEPFREAGIEVISYLEKISSDNPLFETYLDDLTRLALTESERKSRAMIRGYRKII